MPNVHKSLASYRTNGTSFDCGTVKYNKQQAEKKINIYFVWK